MNKIDPVTLKKLRKIAKLRSEEIKNNKVKLVHYDNTLDFLNSMKI